MARRKNASFMKKLELTRDWAGEQILELHKLPQGVTSHRFEYFTVMRAASVIMIEFIRESGGTPSAMGQAFYRPMLKTLQRQFPHTIKLQEFKDHE